MAASFRATRASFSACRCRSCSSIRSLYCFIVNRSCSRILSFSACLFFWSISFSACTLAMWSRWLCRRRLAFASSLAISFWIRWLVNLFCSASMRFCSMRALCSPSSWSSRMCFSSIACRFISFALSASSFSYFSTSASALAYHLRSSSLSFCLLVFSSTTCLFSAERTFWPDWYFFTRFSICDRSSWNKAYSSKTRQSATSEDSFVSCPERPDGASFEAESAEY
mmetsp:Transcript_1359/g.3121  ORF Transcript_1359/g.3121 Transcript_1359/m.3121 type:complete len:225 (-) Transcript_1359:462-1136(-)